VKELISQPRIEPVAPEAAPSLENVCISKPGVETLQAPTFGATIATPSLSAVSFQQTVETKTARAGLAEQVQRDPQPRERAPRAAPVRGRYVSQGSGTLLDKLITLLAVLLVKLERMLFRSRTQQPMSKVKVMGERDKNNNSLSTLNSPSRFSRRLRLERVRQQARRQRVQR
jgi:hypothetical protein